MTVTIYDLVLIFDVIPTDTIDSYSSKIFEVSHLSKFISE